MLGSRLRTGAIALLFGAAGLLLMPGGAGAEARRTTARAPGQTSIPSTPAAATTTVPQDPYLAPDGTGYVHNDSYQSDTYTWSGPPAGSTRVRARSLGGQCAPAAVDSAGRLVTACQQSSGIQLLLINPTTLKTLASFGLPATDILRFGYFFLDNQDRVVIPTPTGQIWTIAETSNGGVPGFSLVGSVDLSSHLADSTDWIFSVLPDWSGRQWFQSHEGVVGWVDPTSGAVSTLSLGEQITNSAAIDETGGVFVVTDYALYRIDPDPSSGAPVVTWRETYDRGTRIKPGQTDQGSGTSPTLMGSSYVATGDNADPQMHVLIYQRAKTVTASRLLCSVPVFADNESATDSSFIGTDTSLIVKNGYGYTGPTSVSGGGSTTPGVARVDINPSTQKCKVIWVSDERAGTAFGKLSLSKGLVYLYTKDPTTDGTDLYDFTTLGFGTGATISKVLAGTGTQYDGHYGAITLSPAGVEYLDVLKGIVALR